MQKAHPGIPFSLVHFPYHITVSGKHTSILATVTSIYKHIFIYSTIKSTHPPKTLFFNSRAHYQRIHSCRLRLANPRWVFRVGSGRLVTEHHKSWFLHWFIFHIITHCTREWSWSIWSLVNRVTFVGAQKWVKIKCSSCHYHQFSFNSNLWFTVCKSCMLTQTPTKHES